MIKDAMMDSLINGITPYSRKGTAHFRVIRADSTNEGNVCTKAQVAALKVKNWKPEYYDGSDWLEYEGSEDYDIIIAAIKNGSITPSVTKAMQGETVTLSVKSDNGYILEQLSIVDSSGNDVEYERDGETATFVMPASAVTVSATFIEATMTVRTSAAGYATFYDSGWAFTLPTGLQAQVVSGVSDGKLNYQKLSDGVIPKDLAVMLTADQKQAADYTLTRTESDAVYTGSNLLHGSDEATTTMGDGLHYKLTYGNAGSNLGDVFGWYWGVQNGGAFKIEGHRAWLVVPKSAGARLFSVDGEANSIDNLQIDDLRFVCPVYDLQGRRVSQPTKKGIYIKDGKKIVNK